MYGLLEDSPRSSGWLAGLYQSAIAISYLQKFMMYTHYVNDFAFELFDDFAFGAIVRLPSHSPKQV